ncbi:CD109 antigen-like [Anopheles albimanus]|uniref:CD109 antigen-like n=1 Tax=Anopheles albimanus TaxID=7167 RepID=UPI00163F2AF2|nr:CD109 antigen-like [Anopheles albimanus]
MWWLRIATICASLILVSLAQELIVIGPNYFTSDRNYTVTIFNMMKKKVYLEATMECRGDDGITTHAVTKPVEAVSKVYTAVPFKIPCNESTKSGKIVFNGKRGFDYNTDYELVYNSTTISGFIQLSKPVYKPGDSVQFRVIVLNRDLKPPAGLKKVTITIQDSNGNNIRIWSDAPLYKGVFEGQLDIAPSPLLGTYEILVKANDEKLDSKLFLVKEYVLSSFYVNVFPSVIPLEEHQALNLTIEANYYSHKPVIGRVKIEFYGVDNKLDFSKQFDVNGMLQVHLPFTKMLTLSEEKKDFSFKVTFTEQHTNRTVSEESSITIYKHLYRARLLSNPVFNPESADPIKLMVEYQDGKPVKGVAVEVKIETLDDSQVDHYTSDNTGIIALSRWNRFSLADEVEIIVSSGHIELLTTKLTKAPRRWKLVIKPLNAWLNLEEPVKLKVTCSSSMTFLLYHIVSKRNVVHFGSETFNRKRSHVITLPKNKILNMMPNSKVLVATVINNTFLYDIVTIESEHLANNIQLKLKDNAREVKSDDSIELLITGRPKSYVALASYDEGLLQHNKNHDISRETILDKFYEQDFYNAHLAQTLTDVDLCLRAGSLVIPNKAEDKSVRMGTPPNHAQSGHLYTYRKDFLESWLWKNITLSRDGSFKLTAATPDSITSWYLTGFSIDPVYGFGIIKKPLQITATLPFYIVDNLPYSIRRGEAVVLQFTLFNTYRSECTINVTMMNDKGQFEFHESSREAKIQTKTIVVPPNAGAPVSFFVKAKTLGEMTVHVKASTMQGREGDAIEKQVRVLPEHIVVNGAETRVFWHEYHHNITNLDFILDINRYAVSGSEKVYFSVSSNLVSKVSQNLDHLLVATKDTGDQNMMSFAPYVMILKYEEARGAKDSKIFEKATNLLQTGYQSQLKFHQTDGSFSVWKHKRGSVYLTAFVAQWMIAAEKYLQVGLAKDLISKAFNWLASKQQANGSFVEDISIVYNDLQTSDRNAIALTSFVMVAFMEMQKIEKKHQVVIANGMAYINGSLNNVNNSFDLSIATYALYLNNHQNKEYALNKLIGLSTNLEKQVSRFWNTTSSQIETAAFALLSLIEAKRTILTIEIMRWLVNQTYETGTFQNSFDTTFGLLAIARLTELITPKKNEYSIAVITSHNGNKDFRIHSSDLLTQTKQMEMAVKNDKKLNVSISGLGAGLLQLTWEYEMQMIDDNKQFALTVEQLNFTSATVLKLLVCSKFNQILKTNSSNQAFVEVNLPSGYVADSNPISNATIKNPIQEIKILYGGTTVEVYYEKMDAFVNCFTITAYRVHSVAFRSPAYVKVQDVYNRKHYAILYYEVTKQEVCDICSNEDCPDSCKHYVG